MTSQEQVARLLAMVPYLQAHPGIGVAEVAADFGITRRQLLADLNVLWMCGLPGGLPDEIGWVCLGLTVPVLVATVFVWRAERAASPGDRAEG